VLVCVCVMRVCVLAMRLAYKKPSFSRYAYAGEDQCLSPGTGRLVKIWWETTELELIQSYMAQKPVLRGEVGVRVCCA